jgi:hypothetical protein
MGVEAPADRYRETGYVLLPRYLDPELGSALTAQFMTAIRTGEVVPQRKQPQIMTSVALELHGHRYAPLQAFHWGMTSGAAALAGCALVPTYCFLRIYRRGDVCLVHRDRPACEHSLSVVLALGDGMPWALDLETAKTRSAAAQVSGDFGGEAFESLPMAAGDAVLYRGVEHRHARITPNPNSWSAHLFLHWVDPAGPHADKAHDGKPPPLAVGLS